MANTTTSRTKNCKNPFIESDGYCTQCGGYHFNKRPGGAITFHEISVPEVTARAHVPLSGTGSKLTQKRNKS